MLWHLLLTPPATGPLNMAIDEALLDRARATGEGVVRVYSWSRPTISFGRNQRACGAYDPARATAAGLDVVRRITGGRALLHHREITYSVTAPVQDDDLRTSYTRINALLVDALARIGVAAVVAGRTERLPPPGSAPCFELPAEGELVHAGRKLVGSAQVRDQGAWLQHGSLLVHDDQLRLRDAAVHELPPIPPAATLHDALCREVQPAEFATALFGAVRNGWDAAAREMVIDDGLADRARALADRYAAPEWTWRA
jgi:lipoate-protein ligase A